MQHISFHRNKVAINVLAKDIASAREIYDAAEGYTVIGTLSAQFSLVREGVLEIKRWINGMPSTSVGLGAGDPAQCYKAAMITSQVHPARVNRIFTGCGFAAGALTTTGDGQTHASVLVSLIGTPGDVLILAGVSSSQGTPARVSCDVAVRMTLDSGAHAAKFSPVGGERSLPGLYALAATVARNGMMLIEPTGGIDLDNFGVILQSYLEAGVPRAIPYVYSSITDPQTGNTRLADITRLMEIVKALV